MDRLGRKEEQTEEEKFLRNVETVTKALKERSVGNPPQQEAGQLYQKFSQTRQEPVRLAVALRGFFLKETQPVQRDAYEKYLKGRIRPAVESLIEEEDVEKMKVLEELGWLQDRYLDIFIRMAKEKRKTAPLVWFLQLKARRRAYEEKDFSL